MILNHTSANVIENICIVCDDINDKFCEHEDLNGADDVCVCVCLCVNMCV